MLEPTWRFGTDQLVFVTGLLPFVGRRSDWTANAIVRFNPETETFERFPSDRPNADVRQMLGRKGEAWIAESDTERIRVIRYPSQTS